MAPDDSLHRDLPGEGRSAFAWVLALFVVVALGFATAFLVSGGLTSGKSTEAVKPARNAVTGGKPPVATTPTRSLRLDALPELKKVRDKKKRHKVKTGSDQTVVPTTGAAPTSSSNTTNTQQTQVATTTQPTQTRAPPPSTARSTSTNKPPPPDPCDVTGC